MNKIFVALAVAIVNSAILAQEDFQPRPDWGLYFEKYEAVGTMVVVDGRDSSLARYAYKLPRALQRYSPASTYKIPHTLFALDAGLVADEFQIFPWDGVERSYAPHNQDQNLRSAIRNSALWVFEYFASKLGEDKARAYLEKINYGNNDPSTDAGAY